MTITFTKLQNGSTYNQETSALADGADFGTISNAAELKSLILDFASDSSTGCESDCQWLECYESAVECGQDLVVTTPDGTEVLYSAAA